MKCLTPFEQRLADAAFWKGVAVGASVAILLGIAVLFLA